MAIKIDVKFNEYKAKAGKPLNVRLQSNATNDSIIKTVQDLITDNGELRKEQEGLIKHISELSSQLNKMKEYIQKGSVSETQINILNGASSGSGGGSSTSTLSDITTVSVALTAGVASAQVFSASATLISVPIGYATVDGMTSAEILVPSGLSVAGFTITSLQDCTCIYSYKLL